jgi:crotonobetainyl-CoA:carnitine CoA-transferase CaiB-like acyl-CoA transferase
MDRLGYGYEDFRNINPRIIYCSGSGYGDSGPYVTRPGQDMLLQGLTGLLAATGRRDGPPVPVGAGFADQIGAFNIVYAVLCALHWRDRSGEGQEIKVDLMSGLLQHQNQEMVWVMNFGEDFERPNSSIGHPGMDAPFGVYPTRDGWITIAMSPYARLVGVLDAPDLLAYDDSRTLFDKRDEIWEKIAEETAKWSKQDLLDALLAADIWCGEVKTHLEAMDDPQVKHRGVITSYEHPKVGRVKVIGPAVRMSGTPPKIERPAPMIGQHTEEILREYGVDRKTITDLEARKVVEQAAVPAKA